MGSDERDDDERSLFEQAMADVEPVRGPRPRAQAAGEAAARARLAPAAPRFTVERDGRRVSALLEGHRPRLLARLKGGGYPLERRVDLHGFTEREAREEVAAELAAAWARGERCVLVIHGRGRGSVGGRAVLREALPGLAVVGTPGDTHRRLRHRSRRARRQRRDAGAAAQAAGRRTLTQRCTSSESVNELPAEVVVAGGVAA